MARARGLESLLDLFGVLGYLVGLWLCCWLGWCLLTGFVFGVWLGLWRFSYFVWVCAWVCLGVVRQVLVGCWFGLVAGGCLC